MEEKIREIIGDVTPNHKYKVSTHRNTDKIKTEQKNGLSIDFSQHKMFCKTCRASEYFNGKTFDDENKDIIEDFRKRHIGCGEK